MSTDLNIKRNRKVELEKMDNVLCIVFIEIQCSGNEKIIDIYQLRPTFTKKGLLDKFANDKIRECFKFLEIEYVQL